MARARFLGHLVAPRSFVVGPRIHVARGATLSASEGVSVGADCTFMAHVEIGPDVMVSSNVAFVGDDHPFQGLDEPITSHRPNPMSKIVVEGDSLIGYGAILVGPLRVKRGAIVAAGAVVTSDLESDTVYAGVPARAVRRRRRATPPEPCGDVS